MSQEEIVFSVHCTSDSNLYGTFRNRLIHPKDEVRRAYQILSENKSVKVFSNSCDFVMAMKYIGEAMGLKVQFFLDDVNQGNDIEKIFEQFNGAYSLLEQIVDGIKKNSIATIKKPIGNGKTEISSKNYDIEKIERRFSLGDLDHVPFAHVGITSIGETAMIREALRKHSDKGFHVIPANDDFLNEKFIGSVGLDLIPTIPMVWDANLEVKRILWNLDNDAFGQPERGVTITKTFLPENDELSKNNRIYSASLDARFENAVLKLGEEFDSEKDPNWTNPEFEKKEEQKKAVKTFPKPRSEYHK